MTEHSIFYNYAVMKAPSAHIFVMCCTSPQVHGVSLTFVREVESRVIQDESDQERKQKAHKDLTNLRVNNSSKYVLTCIIL